ncbi:MAG: hypothetical protein COA42_00635 [Alteromonadaceae bacterium]|nr:MAG: hypothetical protein COA42_00635 [Alteromonadaceae bacterium]
MKAKQTIAFEYSTVARQTTTSTAPNFGLTEIIIPTAEPTANDAVLSMLAYLSQHAGDRWLTWITTTPVHKSQISDFNFALNKIRLVHISHTDKSLSVLKSALEDGSSASVVASLDYLNEKSRKTLENASIIGSCKGLIIRRP